MLEVIRSFKDLTLDEKVSYLAKKYGQDEYLAKKIIHCESTGRPHAVNINVDKHTGYSWSQDIGYWQINDFYHANNEAGFNIYDPDENLEYGFWLLSQEAGTGPWYASKHCWHG